MEFFIHKENGKFQNIRKMEDYNKSLPDGRYRVVIEPYAKRSLSQNNWIHAVLPDIKQGLRDVGFDDIRTEDDAKNFIKSIFFIKEVSNGTETVKVIEGTSNQSKINFAEKADDIIRWAAEYLNINIAPPDKQLELI
jgi:hypothetical protein